jgi:lysophospholipase L1-like esterase
MYRLAVILFVILVSITLVRKENPMPRQEPPNPRILAFGDSLTYGFGTRDPERESYPARLAHLSGQPVVNAGINGETTAEGLRRIGPLLKRHRPGLTILCLGGNDILRGIPEEEIEKNLEKLIERILGSGSALLLVAVPDFGILGLRPLPLYRRLAEKYRLPLVEGALSQILSDPALKSDSIHPNAAGYFRLAKAIYEKLREEGMLFGVGEGF